MLFTFVSAFLTPVIALTILNNEYLPSVIKILKPKNKADILAYLNLPIIIIALHFFNDWAGFHHVLNWHLLLLFSWVVATHDFIHKKIPNSYVLSFFVVWIMVTVPQMFSNIEMMLPYLRNSAFGALLGGGMFMLVYIVSRKGLGGGDVKFMTIAGLYLGVSGVLPVVLIASILTSITGVVLILSKRMDRKGSLPFAPFLYISIIIVMFLGGI